MQAIPVKIVPQGFGETRRRDWWWIEPMIVVVVFSSFLGYGTWAALQNAHFEFGPYLSPFYAPVLWGESHHAVFGPRPDWWPAGAVLPGAAHPADSRACSASPATTTAAPTTRRSGPTRSSCAVGEPRGTALPGRALVPAGPAERPPLLRLRRPSSSSSCSRTTSGSACGSRPGDRRHGVRHRRRHAGDGWSTSSCSPATPSAATRCGTWSAAARTRSRSRRSARPATTARARSTSRHMLFAW